MCLWIWTHSSLIQCSELIVTFVPHEVTWHTYYTWPQSLLCLTKNTTAPVYRNNVINTELFCYFHRFTIQGTKNDLCTWPNKINHLMRDGSITGDNCNMLMVKGYSIMLPSGSCGMWLVIWCHDCCVDYSSTIWHVLKQVRSMLGINMYISSQWHSCIKHTQIWHVQ